MYPEIEMVSVVYIYIRNHLKYISWSLPLNNLQEEFNLELRIFIKLATSSKCIPIYALVKPCSLGIPPTEELMTLHILVMCGLKYYIT